MVFLSSGSSCRQDRPCRQIEVESRGISWNLVEDSSCDN